MEFSEFAADRTFYREGQKVTARFVYGPNVKSDVVPYGGDIPTLTFKAFTTEATATGTYVKATTAGNYLEATQNVNWGRFVSPTVTVAGTAGSGATGSASMTTTPNATTFDAFDLVAVKMNNSGTGYTSDGTITYTFTDHTALGTAKQLANSTGTGIAQYVRVKNGGSGFIPTGTATSTVAGIFTNRLPKLEFLVGGSVPITGSQPSAEVVIDQTGIGTISFVSVGNGGSGFTAAPTVRARYAFPSVVTITGSTSNSIFQLGSDGKSLQFSSVIQAAGISQIQALAVGNNFTTTTSSITFNGGTNSVYTFVPTASVIASVTSGAAPIVTTPQMQVTVNTDRNSTNVGRIESISMNGGDFSNAFTANGPAGTLAFATSIAANTSISLTLAEPTNTLDFYPTDLVGSGLNNYLFTPTTPPTAPSGNFQTVVPSFQFALAGSNTGNTSDFVLAQSEALKLITANEFIVVASAPTATVSNPSHAYGIPVYDNGAIAGIRMLWGGSGYVAGTDATLEIMPNPFYNWRSTTQLANHVSINGTNLAINGLAAQTITIGTATAVSNATAFGFNVVGTVAQKLVNDRYNVSTANKQASVGSYKRQSTAAKLTVTLTNQGSNYAGTPVISIYAGDRLVSQTVSLAVQGDIKVVEGGKVALKDAATNDNVGVLTRTWDLTDAQDNDFDVHGITTVKVFIYDRLSGALTKEFADRVAGNPATGVAPSAAIELTQDGKVEGIYLNTRRNAQGMIEAKNNTPMATRVDWNYAPTVTVSAPSTTGGVTATASVLISTDNGNSPGSGANNGTNFSTVGTSINGEIYGFTVSNGGSGYAPGNRFYNRGDNKGNLVGTVDFTGQDFRVIGGQNGTGVDPGNTNGSGSTAIGNENHDRTENNYRFDVFTGISYVRDIHYGTGKEVE